MKKKVTIITENLYGGGVQRILQIICNHFDYERYNLTVYSVIPHKFTTNTYLMLLNKNIIL